MLASKPGIINKPGIGGMTRANPVQQVNAYVPQTSAVVNKPMVVKQKTPVEEPVRQSVGKSTASMKEDLPDEVSEDYEEDFNDDSASHKPKEQSNSPEKPKPVANYGSKPTFAAPNKLATSSKPKIGGAVAKPPEEDPKDRLNRIMKERQ